MISKLKRPALNKAPQRYPLGKSYPGTYLNRRQAQCVKYLLEGKKIKDIGIVLGLSPRTVDYYIKSIRSKLNCKTRSELLALIKNSDFVRNCMVIQPAKTHLDEKNCKAIELLKVLGNINPTEKQINLIKNLLAAKPDFDLVK